MIAGAKGRRRIPEIAVVSIIYLISLLAAFLFVQRAFMANPGLPAFAENITGLLLVPLALVFLIVFFSGLLRTVHQLSRHEWGSKLKLKLLILFSATTLMSAVPPGVFLNMLILRIAELPGTATMQEALQSGTDLVLSYYQYRETQLRNVALDRLPNSLLSHGPDAAALLADLQKIDPAVQGLELRSGQQTLSFSGPQESRTPEPILPTMDNGFLPRLATSDGSWARFYIKNIDYGGRTTISAIVALRYPDELETAALKLSLAHNSMQAINNHSQSLQLYLLYFVSIYVFPLLTLSLLFSLAASDLLLRPIGNLEEAFKRIRSGRKQTKILTKHGDESGLLIENFNAMLDSLERSRDDELRNEKIEVWQDIARRLAHELRNPLTPIKLSAERVLRRYRSDPDSIREILEKSMIAIVQETSNMESLLGEFQDFARLPEAQKNWLRLSELVNETVLLYSASYPAMHFETANIAPAIVVKADRGYLKQALGNLITNAADATDYRGTVQIQAELVKTAESRYCRILLRDNGHGIPQAIADKIFSPYFTTKEHGTGLGLAVVEHVVNSHGGTIRLESIEGQGTVFYIDLPADDTPLVVARDSPKADGIPDDTSPQKLER